MNIVLYIIILILFIVGYASQPLAIYNFNNIFSIVIYVPYLELSIGNKSEKFDYNSETAQMLQVQSNSLNITLPLCIVTTIVLVIGIILELLHFSKYSKIAYGLATLLFISVYFVMEFSDIQLTQDALNQKSKRTHGYILITVAAALMLIVFCVSLYTN